MRGIFIDASLQRSERLEKRPRNDAGRSAPGFGNKRPGNIIGSIGGFKSIPHKDGSFSIVTTFMLPGNDKPETLTLHVGRKPPEIKITTSDRPGAETRVDLLTHKIHSNLGQSAAVAGTRNVKLTGAKL